jgi:membrane protease YdiL (CAAX protease family)
MFKHLTERAKATVFYAIALVLALVVAIAPIPDDPKPLLTMFVPAIAVLVMLLVVTRDGYSRAGWADLGLHRPGWRRWPMALLAPLLLVGAAYVVAWGSGALALAAGIGGQTLFGVVVDVLLGIAIGTATYTLGEELGWSGYLLPRLSVLGQERASGLRGVMHALWHFPLIFLTSTYLAEGNRLITVPLFVITLTGAGFAYGYLRFSTDSVWPGTIAHAAFNTMASAFAGLTDPSTPEKQAYLVGEGGILMAAGALVLAAWSVKRMYAATHPLDVAPPAVEAGAAGEYAPGG